MDIAGYRPAPQVEAALAQVTFVAVVGPTAAGKTTLIQLAAAREPRLHMLVGSTSRAPRPGERDGVDFHFDTVAAMQARVAARGYVTVAAGATGDLYATAIEDYAVGKVSVMAVLAHAMPLFRSLPYGSFRTVFVVPPSAAAWAARLAQHSFTAEQYTQRLREAEVSLSFALEDYETRFVVNADMATAADDLVTLALGEPLPARLQADQRHGRRLAGELLAQLTNQSKNT